MSKLDSRHFTAKPIALQKSAYFNNSIICVSTEELVDEINAAYVKNHDNLQSVNNTKLMEKSKLKVK